FPNASVEFAPIAMTLGLIGIFYGAILSFAQTDIKRLVAYSSISHMGFVLIGIYASTHLALQGAVVQMVAHGLSAAALFILCGQLYERIHTRDMREMGGLWARIPYLPALSMFFAIASLGMPGTGNFVGEFLILFGTFADNPWVVVIATFGLVLASAYSLIMIHRAYFGAERSGDTLRGLDTRELHMVLSLVVLLVLLGLYPQPVLDTSAQSMNAVQHWLGHALSNLVPPRSQSDGKRHYATYPVPLRRPVATADSGCHRYSGDTVDRLAAQARPDLHPDRSGVEPGPAVADSGAAGDPVALYRTDADRQLCPALHGADTGRHPGLYYPGTRLSRQDQHR